MKKVATLLTLLISVAAFAGSGSKPKPDRIWITDAIIVSPDNLDHIEKGSVLIEDGHIARVERAESEETRRRDRSFGQRTIFDSRADGLARTPVFYSRNWNDARPGEARRAAGQVLFQT